MERETDFSKYENMLYLKRPVSRNQLQNLENGKNQAAPRVTVTCFIPDEYKAGGAYRTFTAAVKKIDHDRRGIILQNGTQEGECVLLDDILKLDIHMDFDSRI